MRNVILITATMFAASVVPSFAAQTTVNSYTQSEEAKARSAIIQAGYRPEALEASQSGTFFFTATKGNDLYSVTVTPDGKIYVSTGLPIQGSNNKPAG
ncbi:MAG TPA: hypothetical protein VKB67_10755 [Rhizomicrobium sp.]|nr:hypothetical protein [Rhizomicrobium sp.]